MTVDDNHNYMMRMDVICKNILSTCGLEMELRCQGYTDGNQLIVDLIEYYEPCMSPSLSQGLPL